MDNVQREGAGHVFSHNSESLQTLVFSKNKVNGDISFCGQAYQIVEAIIFESDDIL